MPEEATGRGGAEFEPPTGYARVSLAELPDIDGKELWVIRVPEGVDAAALDGVSFPVSALNNAQQTLTHIQHRGHAFDLHSAQEVKASENGDRLSSQLIDMAAPRPGRVFLERGFSDSPQSAGIASELSNVTVLVPKNNNKLRMASLPVTRRMYMSIRAPETSTSDGVIVPLPPKRSQPWDRLKGVFRPVGAYEATPTAKTGPKSTASMKSKDKTKSKDKEKSKDKKSKGSRNQEATQDNAADESQVDESTEKAKKRKKGDGEPTPKKKHKA